MKLKFKEWWGWAVHRPTVLVNVIGLLIIIVGGGAYIVYQSVRPVDVLKDWEIAISSAPEYRMINGVRTAIYHPGDSLVFTSKSTKVENSEGTASRMIVCEAVGELKAREIQLDTLPATRPAGQNPERENAIVVPDVAQFAGLPRTCYLVIDIAYSNVALWRGHNEHAQTEPFIVEEAVLNPVAIRKQIQELNDKIDLLEAQLSTAEGSTPPGRPTTVGGASSEEAAAQPATPAPAPANPQPPVDETGFLRGILKSVRDFIL